MAGVRHPNVVDVITMDPNTDECVLVAVEDRRWGDPSNLVQLQQKMEFYLAFALDGELATKFPETHDKRVRVRLECAFAPPAEVRAVLARLERGLRDCGVGFEVQVWPDDSAPPS
jgi:hypothetical protein